MTTLRRELKIKINQVLDSQGIYTDPIPPYPSIVDLLADAVLGVAGISNAYANAEMMGKKSIDTTKERQLLGERIEAQLHIKVDHNAQWKRVLNRLIEEEEKGNTLEKYVAWYNQDENKYDRPKIAQILKNPSLLLGSWPIAMTFQLPESEQTSIYDWIGETEEKEVDLTEIPQATLDRIEQGICTECVAEFGLGGSIEVDCIPIKGGLLCLEHYKEWRSEQLGLNRG